MTEADLHLWLDSYANKDAWKADIAYLEKSIYVDTEVLINGNGAQGSPFDNVNDAKDLVELLGYSRIFASGEIVVPDPLKGMHIHGIGVPRVNLNGQDIKNSRFYEVSLGGDYTDSIMAYNCYLEHNIPLSGHFVTCEVLGTIIASSEAEVTMINCFNGNHDTGTVLSMNAGIPATVLNSGFRGDIKIIDADHVNDKLVLIMNGGTVTIDASCTLGVIKIDGYCTLINNTGGTIVEDKRISTTVWNKVLP